MHADDAVDREQLLTNLVEVEPTGRCLEQDVDGFTQQFDGTRNDEHRDHQRGQRVRALEPRGRDHRGGDEYGGGAKQVRKHLEIGAADVQAPALTPPKQHQAGGVAGQCDDPEHGHQAGLGGARCEQPPDRLEEQERSQPEQHDSVDDRGEDLGALVAEGSL